MQWLFDLMQMMVKQHFKDDFNTVFKHLSPSTGKVVDDDMRSLLFGDYMKPDAVSISLLILLVNNLILLLKNLCILGKYFSTMICFNIIFLYKLLFMNELGGEAVRGSRKS